MDVEDRLREHGIQPSAQRVAVAEYVLVTDEHPSADRVFEQVRGRIPVLSRATVYNTLNLFVERGLLRAYQLREGSVVFDPKVSPHHHFVDEDSGRIEDIPWGALDVRGIEALAAEKGFTIGDYHVIVRGKKRRSRPRR